MPPSQGANASAARAVELGLALKQALVHLRQQGAHGLVHLSRSLPQSGHRWSMAPLGLDQLPANTGDEIQGLPPLDRHLPGGLQPVIGACLGHYALLKKVPP